MTKFKFTQEYPFKTSPKVLFNYISTPGGLQQWFAEKVTMDSNHLYHFTWDEEEHVAELTSSRLNKSTRFEFVGVDEGNYMEFKLVMSEIDNSVFLKITDYSDNADEEDLESVWKGFIADLKEIVGG
ncbi:ATPase [Lacihabitans sp. LS3-19]|uniref:START-like domain-containing protein n=1 Tax=Lacihabitans sp. LS3-19 TaxID=2487335 RepID=UPI0020CE2DAE|nr:START-like domain-containing protein [Lacihabitans sp. LS3-19]MCP9768210.1 ATPase [Lacihabitans sp. LS3-19]